MILVTGGAGFIGSNFILDWIGQSDEPVVNLDFLTYAGHLDNLSQIPKDAKYTFVHGNIGDKALVEALLNKHQPRAVINFAAETHVDRSIDSPEHFIQTNVVGTYQLLDEVRRYWLGLDADNKKAFRFLQISTDEVYGSLPIDGKSFTETTAYAPNNPYAASKAASDHLARSYCHTYGLPVITTHCSNNYGPHQYSEKLIPHSISCALHGEPITVFGNGLQVRDWLHVKDHCAALMKVLSNGRVGEAYNIGAVNEKTNLSVVNMVCNILDELRPRANGLSYKTQVMHIEDRPGHDTRYAINPSKIQIELGWKAQQDFNLGMRVTVDWYLSQCEIAR